MTEGYKSKMNGREEHDVEREGVGCIGELCSDAQGENEKSEMERKEKGVHGSE